VSALCPVAPGGSRLLAKTISWACAHVLITGLVVWALTGDPWAALAIGFLEPLVQTFAYAAHERGWSRRWPGSLSTRLLWLKTFSYFLVHMGVASTLVWCLTGDLRAALTLGLIEPLVQTVSFNCHERFWARREQGRGAQPA
jgi:uncharacterized membrane protein